MHKNNLDIVKILAILFKIIKQFHKGNIMKKLLSLMIILPTLSLADATQDLFQAIEQQSTKKVMAALEQGADIDAVRESDSHSPNTLARYYYNEAIYRYTELTPKNLGLSLGSWTVPIAAFMHNKKYAALSALGVVASNYFVYDKMTQEQNPEAPKSYLQRFNNAAHLDQVFELASNAGFLATAWQSKYTALNIVATAFTAYSYYYKYELDTWADVYSLVSPEGLEVDNAFTNPDFPRMEREYLNFIALHKQELDQAYLAAQAAEQPETQEDGAPCA